MPQAVVPGSPWAPPPSPPPLPPALSYRLVKERARIAQRLLSRQGLDVDLDAVHVLPVTLAEYREHHILNVANELGLAREVVARDLPTDPFSTFDGNFLPYPLPRVLVFDGRSLEGEVRKLGRDELDCMLVHELTHAWQHQVHPGLFAALADAKRARFRHALELGEDHPRTQEKARRIQLLLTFLEGHAVVIEEQIRKRHFPSVEPTVKPLGAGARVAPDLRDVEVRYAVGAQAIAKAMKSPGLLEHLLSDPEAAIAHVERTVQAMGRSKGAGDTYEPNPRS